MQEPDDVRYGGHEDDVLMSIPPDRVGLLQRCSRISRLMLAGLLTMPVILSTPRADVQGQEKSKEVQKAEDPLLTKLRQEIPALIADLNHSHFRHREQAQRRLQQMSTDWVRTKQTPFPLLPLLQPTREYSSEQRRRLERILAAHEHEELQLLWRPIVFQEPPEWKGRKDAPKVNEVLEALEKQTGQRIHLENTKDFTDGAVSGGLNGRTFWEVLERVRQPAGGKFAMYRSRDGSLVVYATDHGIYAAEGNVLGHAKTCYEDYPLAPKRKISMSFLTDSLSFGDASITQATGATDKGRKIILEEKPDIDQLGRVWSRMLGRCTELDMSCEEGEQTIDLTVTVLLRGYETRVETVKDCMKVTTFPVQSYELQIVGVPPSSRDPQQAYWSIYAQLLGKDNENEKQLLANAIQCRAFDVKGSPIKISNFNDSVSDWRWHFSTQPHSLQLVLPERGTQSEKTLLFKGIPLNP